MVRDKEMAIVSCPSRAPHEWRTRMCDDRARRTFDATDHLYHDGITRDQRDHTGSTGLHGTNRDQPNHNILP